MSKTIPIINGATGKLAKTRLSEVAPGEFVAEDIHPDDVPRYGVVKLMRQTDGSYIPILASHSQYARISEDLPSKLGLRELSYKTIYRLAYAGFVKSSRPGPNIILVDIVSLAEHVQKSRDPEFWTPSRRAQWADACTSSKSNRALRP